MDDLTHLARDAGRGNRAALGSFIRESQAEVWRLCAHLVDPEAADDVTQETFLRAIDALPRFRGDASARTWLLQIARRTCADTIRRRTRGRAALDKVRRRRPPAPRDPAGHVSLATLLHDLDADRRDAFVLTQVLGLSYQEAAEICSCPVGTIRSRVARAREQLVRAVRADHDAADDGR